MKRIWKYPLAVVDHQWIEMPRGADILTVQTQGVAVCLWVVVDDLAPKERRYIAIHATGHVLPDSPGKYIGTFQMHDDGALVFHVFDVSHNGH